MIILPRAREEENCKIYVYNTLSENNDSVAISAQLRLLLKLNHEEQYTENVWL